MRNLARIMVILVINLLISAVPVRGWASYEDLFHQLRSAAWAIYLRSPGGLNAICSATAFEKKPTYTLLVTAAHCFIGSDSKTDFLVTQDHLQFAHASLVKTGVRLKSGKNADSTDLTDYTGDDWAIVRADSAGGAVVPIGDSDKLGIGEDLIVVGVPLGVDFLAVQGIVGSTNLSLSGLIWNHAFGANIFVAAGNSGSAVISVKQKAIVGIIVAAPGAQSSMAIFTPINLVQR